MVVWIVWGEMGMRGNAWGQLKNGVGVKHCQMCVGGDQWTKFGSAMITKCHDVLIGKSIP